MVSQNLRSFNLNLLPILDALLTTRNVTQAAELLHMSQPAVSEALAKLRLHFNDPLLEKVGREFKTTVLAESLKPKLAQTLAHIRQLLIEETFEISQLKRRFVIATADIVTLKLAPKLINLVLAKAPNVSIQFIDLQSTSYKALIAGTVDFMILPERVIPSDGLCSMTLFKDSFVCIARKDHPKIGAKLTKSLYQELPHITYRADHKTQNTVETSVIGFNQKDVLRLPQFSLLPFFIENSDAIALVQKSVAQRFEKVTNIRIMTPPIAFPSINVCAYWNYNQDHDKAHQWLRSELKDIMSP